MKTPPPSSCCFLSFLLFFLSFLSFLTRAHVTQQLNVCSNAVVCPNHKTTKTFGELAKYDFDCLGGEKYRFLLKFLLKVTILIARAGRDGEKHRFLIKSLLKTNDFDCPGWPGTAGMEKSIDFYRNSV